MDFSNSVISSKLNNTLLWDYDELIRQLGDTFCVCPSPQMAAMESGTNISDMPGFRSIFVPHNLEAYCDCTELLKDSYPNNQISLCNKNPSVQQVNANSFICEKSENSVHAPLTKADSFGQGTLPDTSQQTNSIEEAKAIKKRRRRSNKLDIKPNLIKVRCQILEQGISAFFCSPKKPRGSIPTNSKRRSKYIGISKNNIHWQALINIGRTKKYIDIFISEEQAAKTYDLYAIAIKGLDACLNFNYTAEEMLGMIDYFLQHEEVPMAS